MITVLAPAKINLTLRILGRRSDGYHALESIMHMITLADTLHIDDADPEVLSFTCSYPSLAHESNLVMRAARLLHPYCAIRRGAAIHLEKRIPTQAGLGGGSSDAAMTLAALNEFWEIRMPMEQLTELGAELGSDVPFFLNGPCGIVRGRGERVTPVIHQSTCHLVLAKPSLGLSTPAVYASLQAGSVTTNHDDNYLPETQAMLAALRSCSPEHIAAAMVNDLEGPAFALFPELIILRERMLEAGCLSVLLCGSGSTLCGICRDGEEASSAAVSLTNDFPWTWSGPWLPFQ